MCLLARTVGEGARWQQSSGLDYGKFGRSNPAVSFGTLRFLALVLGVSAARLCLTFCSIGLGEAANAGIRSAGHGAPWTPESARDEAQRLLGSVANNADPAADKRAARNAQTVSELCNLYLEDAEAGRLMTRRRTGKKASTLVTDRGRIERHIKPLLGSHKVASVTRADIERFMQDVTAGKTA